MTTAHEWEGPVGDVWAREWRRTDRSFSGLAPHLDSAILAAAPEHGRAIDIGCGAGETSLTLASVRPGLDITGIDIAAALISIARERADGVPNLSFAAADVTAPLPDLAPLDLLFSRHGVMFFADPVVGFAALRESAASGARIVFSCFREASLNAWADELVGAVTGKGIDLPDHYAPGPFAFADPHFVTDVLARAGWHAIERQPIDFPYRAGEGMDPVADALAFFRSIGPTAPLLRAMPPEARPAVMDRFAEIIECHRRDGVVDFPAAAWIWIARA